MNTDFIQNSLNEAKQTLDQFINDSNNLELIAKSIATFTETIKGDGRIMACGNGGSMCDSMHFVEELTGRYRKDRDPICAINMGDPSHITCVANDYGYDYIFSRHVQAWGRDGSGSS